MIGSVHFRWPFIAIRCRHITGVLLVEILNDWFYYPATRAGCQAAPVDETATVDSTTNPPTASRLTLEPPLPPTQVVLPSRSSPSATFPGAQ